MFQQNFVINTKFCCCLLGQRRLMLKFFDIALQDTFSLSNNLMMKIKKQKALRSKYKSINSSDRALIVQYIEEYKYSTSHVSMITGHNASTIKAIYSVYKKQGRINKKAKRDKILNITFQLLQFVVDSQGNLTKISAESLKCEKQIVEEGQVKQLQTSHELAIKNFLELNKLKVIELLDNPTALDTFNQEIKHISQQEFPSQQFSSLKLIPQSSQKEQANMEIKNNFKYFLDLFSEKQMNKGKEEENKSIIVKKLNEQYRLMNM